MDQSKRKFAGNALGAASILVLLLLVPHPAVIWVVSPAVSGNLIVAFFLAALILSIAAGLMASRWWLGISCSLFALYLAIAIGEALWEWKATGGH